MTDATPDIIRRYVEKGWIVAHIAEPDTGYHQKKWVDRMVIAAKAHGADWIINADADEFWFPPTENFKTLLAETAANVLRCRVVNMLPREDRPFTEWDEVVQPVDEPARYGLSPSASTVAPHLRCCIVPPATCKSPWATTKY